MVNVFDVAAYILKRQGPMTHLKLQKLVYYAQAWSLVWDESPLFREKIEAWVGGPVVPKLFDRLRHRFKVDYKTLGAGDPDRLNSTQRETLDAVLDYYAPQSSQYLSDLTHLEEPWQEARRGLATGERGKREITRASMAIYYGSL
jgi:uncharacterized phage-associated protein